jgi:tRNA pseudouridine38-40 synthase
MVPADFHPRFDALSRRYRYLLFFQPVRHPLRERFAWRVWPGISGEVLPAIAKLFLGTYDFSAFGSPTTPRGGTVRTVMKAEWSQNEEDGTWRFDVEANAFLYRMVRRLVFVQVAAAQGKASPEAIAQSLEPASPERRPRDGAALLPAGLAPRARADACRSGIRLKGEPLSQ